MDIKSFLKFIARYRWIVIAVPIIVIIGTFFIVSQLPKQYGSQVSISTGLLDPSKKIISDQTVDFFQISQQFKGIMEKIEMKKNIDILSYNLILHDLGQPKQAFRKADKMLDGYTQKEKAEIISLYEQKQLKKSLLTSADNKLKYPLAEIVESMGYDEESLKKKLSVTHAENSDLINIEFISESPVLSAYVVNTLAAEFINNYSIEVNNNQNSSIILLDSLLKKKEQVMAQKNASLSDFKRNKGVLNLSEQSAAVYNQITDYEAKRAELIRQIQSDQGAISVIINKLRGGDTFIGTNNRTDNRIIIEMKRQLEKANEAFIDNGFKMADQKKVDSLTRIINARSNQNADENTFDPKTSKQGLVQQKLNLEISLQQAKSSMASIQNELASLKGKYNSMVPFDADIQNYERDAELATKDYTAALDRINNTKTEQNTALKLQIDQLGLASNPLPSKHIVYTAGAGFMSFALCIGVLMVIFLLDHSIRTPRQLELTTKSKSLGSLNLIEGNERLARNIWDDKSDNKNYELYREHLRSIRFKILNDMEQEESKILGVTSLGAKAGKTFVCYSLAYAFAMTGKKILLIADDQPYVAAKTTGLVAAQSFQTFLEKKEYRTEDLITVMNKSSERNSLLEIQSIKSLKAGFDLLRKEFDLIIIDINSLNDVNISKEWLLFSEKNIAVFESGGTIAESDHSLISYIKELPGFLGWILNKVDYRTT